MTVGGFSERESNQDTMYYYEPNFNAWVLASPTLSIPRDYMPAFTVPDAYAGCTA